MRIYLNSGQLSTIFIKYTQPEWFSLCHSYSKEVLFFGWIVYKSK